MATVPRERRVYALHVLLWTVQALLALLFVSVGLMKLTAAAPILVANGVTVADRAPLGVVRLIGLLELMAAAGLVLPSALRVATFLTPLAGLGIILLMAVAATEHLVHGEASPLPTNLLIALLAGFVAWGRSRAVPITSPPMAPPFGPTEHPTG